MHQRRINGRLLTKIRSKLVPYNKLPYSREFRNRRNLIFDILELYFLRSYFMPQKCEHPNLDVPVEPFLADFLKRLREKTVTCVRVASLVGN